MEIALYIRKEYFRGVTLTDKSAHILEFHYEGEHVDVFENGGLVFRFRYVLETKFKANIVEFYIPDMTMRGKGYGSVCMCEILDQLRQKQVTVIRSPFGYALAPIGYTGPDQYRQLMRGFLGATGLEISGDGDEAIQILD